MKKQTKDEMMDDFIWLSRGFWVGIDICLALMFVATLLGFK